MAKITLKKVVFKGENPAKTGSTARKTLQNLKKFLFWAEKSTFILHLRSYCAIILIYVNYCTGIRLRIRGIMSSTTYAKRTHYKPIDFFYRAVVDSKTKKVEFVDAFPMNAAGKILKYKMREDAVKLLDLTDASKIVTA